MSIEQRFDIELIAAMALKEKQIQQNYRPIIAVHKWFARRPGTLFRGLILSEFADRPLNESFFAINDFPNRRVADPFMGGGIAMIEANRVGCDVQGFDINPMAAWIVREEIEHLDLEAYRTAACSLLASLSEEIGFAYRTDCPRFGDRDVQVKYFLWVKTINCEQCGQSVDLFPGYLIADDTRHPKHVFVCSDCGEINEVSNRKQPGRCHHCNIALLEHGPASRNRCTCLHCRHVNAYPRAEIGPPKHRLFAIEYHNPDRRHLHRGRFFKKPDTQDLARYEEAAEKWKSILPRFVPDEKIPPGDETDRLHRWGYQHYREMFNDRQLLGLETSGRRISEINDDRVRSALATNISDLLRYQNMLCRYDTMALKSLDIFSVHGFPVGLIQCESNFLGIANGDNSNVGSGGWSNIIDKYAKAKKYCEAPFEICHYNGKKKVIPMKGEWIGEHLNGQRSRKVVISCTTATSLELQSESLDAVFTDPPYFGNVQYGELMDFCYVWLRRLVGNRFEGFDRGSTRSPDELTGNLTQSRGISHFADGLSSVYRRMAFALKPGAPLVFTFHHNRLEVYHAVGVSILDAGLTCSATLPCPAEMGGSIHIHGTRSSIVDTVFVCRQTGRMKRTQLFDDEEQLRQIVEGDLKLLCAAQLKPTAGDVRCIVWSHLTRMAIWRLRGAWNIQLPVDVRINRFAEEIKSILDVGCVIAKISATLSDRRLGFEEQENFRMDFEDAISF